VVRERYEEFVADCPGFCFSEKESSIRENCSACALGQGHNSYALSGYRRKRRFSVYVPDELAPELERAVEKGRRLHDLIKEAGVRYLRAKKRERRSKLRK
jgi:molybdopterin-guanine dinucleotide biosynthesis protein A